jgi:hypothetical protein
MPQLGGPDAARRMLRRLPQRLIAAEAFFSPLEWEVLSRNTFRDRVHMRAVVITAYPLLGIPNLSCATSPDQGNFARRLCAGSGQ